MYFSLCLLDNTFIRAELAVTLLSSSGYTWNSSQHYAIGMGHANRLAWECLKSDLQSYLKPANYAYQIQVAFAALQAIWWYY